MKKILLILLLFPLLLNAECDYKSEKELSELSTYVDYSYIYNEETKKFDITITNLQNLFYVEYNFKKQDVIDGKSIISNIEYGSNVSLDVKASGATNCAAQDFRTLRINLPYLNPYYKSEKCKEYQNLSVCYSRFLNFKISLETFENTLKREEKIKIKEENNAYKIFNSIFSFAKTNYIKILLVIITSGIWIIIYKNKYRKSKHGF